jgi:hypothetical protein
MAEDILADLMGSFLIVAPAVFGMIFAYWLFKKVRPPPRATSENRERTANVYASVPSSTSQPL